MRPSRPTAVARTPESLADRLEAEQLRLYRLIWRRFLASQMAPALYDTLRAEISASESEAGPTAHLLSWNGSALRFAGFLALLGGDDETQRAPAATARG